MTDIKIKKANEEFDKHAEISIIAFGGFGARKRNIAFFLFTGLLRFRFFELLPVPPDSNVPRPA